MQFTSEQDHSGDGAGGKDFSLHYFLRPDHRDVSDLWLASGRHALQNLNPVDGRDWLFMHLEDLHTSGAHTACAFNRRTGGLAGFVTIDPRSGRLDQIVVARTARGSGVATLLLNEAKRLAPGRIELDITEDNARGIRFCEREGFRKTGVGAQARGKARLWKMRWSGAADAPATSQ